MTNCTGGNTFRLLGAAYLYFSVNVELKRGWLVLHGLGQLRLESAYKYTHYKKKFKTMLPQTETARRC